MNEQQREVIRNYANKVGLPVTSFMRFIVLDFIKQQEEVNS